MDGETCLRQAYEAIFHGDFESAVFWFGQAIAMEPDNAAVSLQRLDYLRQKREAFPCVELCAESG